MDKVKWLGIFALAGGLCLLGYQGLEKLMSEGAIYNTYTLLTTFGEDAFGWNDGLPIVQIRQGIDYVIHMPLFALLLIIGTVFLAISGIFGKK